MFRDLRIQYCGPISVRSTFVLALVLTVLALFALLPSPPNKVFADNNAYTFQGQYTAPACGPRHDFVVGPNTKTIDVVASTLPVNDIVLKLYYGGVVVAEQDTGTSPEPIHYGTGSNLATGTYQVEVCPFEGQAVLTPSDYAGVIALRTSGSTLIELPFRVGLERLRHGNRCMGERPLRRGLSGALAIRDRLHEGVSA